MRKSIIAGGIAVAVVVLLASLAAYRRLNRRAGVPRSLPPESANVTVADAHPSLLYGRVTTVGGRTYEGRLRWGHNEEAFWGDYFNGYKPGNPWSVYVPKERLPRRRDTITIFGVEIANQDDPISLDRPFMVRFGDVARIEVQGRDVRVTLKSGTELHLDGNSSGDIDDGVRVWDARQGIVALAGDEIRAVEFLSPPQPGAAPQRLHGTMRTRQGDFTGFLQWNRKKGLGSDELEGDAASGEVRLRFDTIRSVARRQDDSSLVTLVDGREMILAGTADAGRDSRGIYVDDRRYGRVLVSWNGFERVEFSAGGSGPAYTDFLPGRPLRGSVTTRAGRRIAGRLVFDLDESETTETLDAPSRGVDYTITFGLIASIAVPARERKDAGRAKVTLHSGEQLELECRSDLGEGNAGMLVFEDGQPKPEYVPWSEVERVDLDRPPDPRPALSGHNKE